jgi:hypothetical protein
MLILWVAASGCGRQAEGAGALMDDTLTEEQAAQASAITALDQFGAMVNWEQQDGGDPRLEVHFANKPVTDAQMKEIVRQLKRSKEFRYLNLSGTEVTDNGLRELREVKHLQTLLLARTDTTDGVLKDLKQVESLDLSNTPVTDEGVKELKNHHRLKWLNLERTNVTARGLGEIKEALPGCTVVP